MRISDWSSDVCSSDLTDAIKIELLDPPSKPTSPSAPNRPLFLTIVLLAGLGGGVGAAYGLAQVRVSYPTEARLEGASGLPVPRSTTEVVTLERQLVGHKRIAWLGRTRGGLVSSYSHPLTAQFLPLGI